MQSTPQACLKRALPASSPDTLERIARAGAVVRSPGWIEGGLALSYPITAIAGIGPAMSAKLKALGIRTTEKLLELAATAKDRKILAEKLDVSGQTVLRWANLADLMSIKGVRWPYAELLKFAGLATVKELKYRNPAKLAQAMADANAKRKLVQLLPSEKRIANWIDDARKLPPKISY